jgi:hypothetical protein
VLLEGILYVVQIILKTDESTIICIIFGLNKNTNTNTFNSLYNFQRPFEQQDWIVTAFLTEYAVEIFLLSVANQLWNVLNIVDCLKLPICDTHDILDACSWHRHSRLAFSWLSCLTIWLYHPDAKQKMMCASSNCNNEFGNFRFRVLYMYLMNCWYPGECQWWFFQSVCFVIAVC